MTPRRNSIATLLLVSGLVLAGCGSSNTPPPAEPPPPPPPPPPPQAVDFTEFVREQFAMTADDTDPVSVDDTDFAFNDQDDPDAFNDLLDNP